VDCRPLRQEHHLRQLQGDGARRDDGRIITRSAFAALKWPKPKTPEPDPFTSEERSRILGWFRHRLFSFNAGRSTQGPRFGRIPPTMPSCTHCSGPDPTLEAAGLQWRDIDLDRGRLHVRRSRHLWQYGDPKTDAARRTVELFPETCGSCGRFNRCESSRSCRSSRTRSGSPSSRTHSSPLVRLQRALGIRVRGSTARRHARQRRAQRRRKIAWLENQTGVNYATSAGTTGSGCRARARASCVASRRSIHLFEGQSVSGREVRRTQRV